MKKIGLYIHIPFCNQRCLYCDFYSQIKGSSIKEAYTNTVISAIKNQPFGELECDTLYFGGGTPSIMEAQALVDIFQAAKKQFHFKASAEISLEANPESTTAEFLSRLRSEGFTRISFGVQSSNEKELKALGRIHSAKEAEQAILGAKAAGFQHISADLMLGIPYQTEKSMKESIAFLTQLPLDHVSAYMLSIEEGTPFHRMNMQQHCMTEDQLSESYLSAVAGLEKVGFEQYEISNFAKKSGESKHNLKYWKTQEYLGIGPSAHSFFEGKRFSIPSSLDDFIKTKGDWNCRNIDSNGGDFAEFGMLRLRLKSGLDLAEYKNLYPEIDKEKMMSRARLLEKDGFMVIAKERIHFTPEGFLLSNYLIAQLLF